MFFSISFNCWMLLNSDVSDVCVLLLHAVKCYEAQPLSLKNSELVMQSYGTPSAVLCEPSWMSLHQNHRNIPLPASRKAFRNSLILLALWILDSPRYKRPKHHQKAGTKKVFHGINSLVARITSHLQLRVCCRWNCPPFWQGYKRSRAYSYLMLSVAYVYSMYSVAVCCVDSKSPKRLRSFWPERR